MSLLDLRNYLSQVKIASLANISAYFKINPELLRDMLSHWIRKGKVRKFAKSAACGGKCVKCDPMMVEIYEWC